MTKQKLESIILLIIAVLTTININNQLIPNCNIPSLCLSIIGIVGIIFYFIKPNSLKPFLYIWLSLQLIVIEKTVLDSVSQTYTKIPILELSQVLSFIVGLDITSGNNVYGISINLPIIILLFIIKKFWK